MPITLATLSFILGTVLASFIGNVASRLQRQEEFISKPSHCDRCGHPLNAIDLLPMIGYLFRRGKCHYCGTTIPILYPIMELISGLLFAGALLRYQNLILGTGQEILTGAALVMFAWVMISLLLFVAVFDLMTMSVIPEVVYAGTLIAFLFQTVLTLAGIQSFQTYLNIVVAAVLSTAFIAALVLMTREQGMGIGDIALTAMITLMASWPGAGIALMIAFFSGAITGLMLIIMGRKKIKHVIPFAPFLAFGGIAGLLAGSEIVTFYLDHFLFF